MQSYLRPNWHADEFIDPSTVNFHLFWIGIYTNEVAIKNHYKSADLFILLYLCEEYTKM